MIVPSTQYPVPGKILRIAAVCLLVLLVAGEKVVDQLLKRLGQIGVLLLAQRDPLRDLFSMLGISTLSVTLFAVVVQP